MNDTRDLGDLTSLDQNLTRGGKVSTQRSCQQVIRGGNLKKKHGGVLEVRINVSGLIHLKAQLLPAIELKWTKVLGHRGSNYEGTVRNAGFGLNVALSSG